MKNSFNLFVALQDFWFVCDRLTKYVEIRCKELVLFKSEVGSRDEGLLLLEVTTNCRFTIVLYTCLALLLSLSLVANLCFPFTLRITRIFPLLIFLIISYPHSIRHCNRIVYRIRVLFWNHHVGWRNICCHQRLLIFVEYWVGLMFWRVTFFILL